MKQQLKRDLFAFLQASGASREDGSLLQQLEAELCYVDINCMSICNDDEGCADLSDKQLIELAELMSKEFLTTTFAETLEKCLKQLKTREWKQIEDLKSSKTSTETTSK